MKIIQLNIWGGNLFDHAVEFLRKEKPDIVTMQEVPVFPKNNILLKMEKTLGMKSVFARAFGIREHGSIVYRGNAVLSRFYIVSSKSAFYDTGFRVMKNRGLTSAENIEDIFSEPRNFLSVIIDTPDGKLGVVTTHLAWSEHCSESLQRIQQAKKLVKSLKGKMPTILTGDFNTHSDSTSFRIINSSFVNLGKGIKNTLNTKRHKVFMEKPEGLVVDYILARNLSGSAKTVDADVSDHLPLVANIKF